MLARMTAMASRDDSTRIADSAPRDHQDARGERELYRRCEGERFELGNLVEPRKGIAELSQRGFVERAGIVEQMPAAQRSKAGVQVVEARVDQMERVHGDVPGVGNMPVGRPAGADAVSGPQLGSFGVENDVAFALEGGFAWRVDAHPADRRRDGSFRRLHTAPHGR